MMPPAGGTAAQKACSRSSAELMKDVVSVEDHECCGSCDSSSAYDAEPCCATGSSRSVPEHLHQQSGLSLVARASCSEMLSCKLFSRSHFTCMVDFF
jgi:hypothetical protein